MIRNCREDGCKGRFFEKRFSSDSLLTEEALLSCMSYVNLNPIRAGLSDTPETSDFTRIQERIKPVFNLTGVINNQLRQGFFQSFDIDLKPLLSFNETITDEEQKDIPFTLNDYLELVDWTGRVIRADKRGSIPLHLPPILQRLHIDRKR